MKMYFLMGCTCSGKGAFIKAAKSALADDPKLGFIEVGEEFRKRYPPEHFQGQANPQHLMQEAMEIYAQCLERERAANRESIIVDGQPRQGQVDPILALHPNDQCYFILLHAPEEVRRSRAATRFPDPPHGGNPELEMTLQRIKNDYRTYYETLVELLVKSAPTSKVYNLYLISTDTKEPSDWICTLADQLDKWEKV